MKPPFITTIFSLSSHHPYSIPEKYKNRFPKGSFPIDESVGYADYSLKTFFEEASKQPWFKNTLFVLTADHTGPSEQPHYQTRTGIYKVPIVYYCPSDSLMGTTTTVTQQCDILPSILSYLHYSGNFSAFGNSIFAKEKNHFAVNYMNNSYQLITDDLVLLFDGERTTGLYDYKNDLLLEHNLASKKSNDAQWMELKLKAIIQHYQQGMLHNKLIKK